VYKCWGRSSILNNNTGSLLRARAIDGQLCKKVNGLVKLKNSGSKGGLENEGQLYRRCKTERTLRRKSSPSIIIIVVIILRGPNTEGLLNVSDRLGVVTSRR
jgi:hypothetical protein